MSHFFSPFCTLCAKDGRRKDLGPNEGFRSKGWAYCEACYIRRFPKAAEERGLTKKAQPSPKRAPEPVKPVQEALFTSFTSGGCGCQG
jgi:hypothetical protein